MKAIRADAALAGMEVYEIAMLEGAPGLFRGMIKSGMRKGMSSGEQERMVVLTQDDKVWEKYFQVSNGQEPQVMLLDAKGKCCVAWAGKGGGVGVSIRSGDNSLIGALVGEDWRWAVGCCLSSISGAGHGPDCERLMYIDC